MQLLLVCFYIRIFLSTLGIISSQQISLLASPRPVHLVKLPNSARKNSVSVCWQKTRHINKGQINNPKDKERVLVDVRRLFGQCGEVHGGGEVVYTSY